jgi:hypothetical protein
MARCRNRSGFALRGCGHAEDFTFCAMNRSPLWPDCLEARHERPAPRDRRHCKASVCASRDSKSWPCCMSGNSARAAPIARRWPWRASSWPTWWPSVACKSSFWPSNQKTELLPKAVSQNRISSAWGMPGLAVKPTGPRSASSRCSLRLVSGPAGDYQLNLPCSLWCISSTRLVLCNNFTTQLGLYGEKSMNSHSIAALNGRNSQWLT